MDPKTVAVNSVSMEYVSFGEGERAFVIIPGMSVTSVVVAADAVRAAYSDFEKTHTVYLFDRKLDIEEGYSLYDMAEDTALAMKALGIKNADIFGASQGGMIAQIIAADHPELVHRLVLGSTCAKMNATFMETLELWISLAKAGDVVGLNRAFVKRAYGAEFIKKYAEAFKAMEKNGTAEDMCRFAILAEACKGVNSYGILEKITCPLLVMGSYGDNVLTGEASEEIAEKTGCELYMYDGYGHAVYDEAPDYRERIMAFLKE